MSEDIRWACKEDLAMDWFNEKVSPAILYGSWKYGFLPHTNF